MTRRTGGRASSDGVRTTSEPATTRGDGRNIDPAVGSLEGEGAQQAVPGDRAAAEGAVPYEVWTGLPSGDGPRRADATYYERPVVKKSVWKWYIPAYLYAGGTAGAAAALAATAHLIDGRALQGLVRRARWIAAAGSGAGTVLLILDLGRPARFLNMLRVFRPTSPMNVGSWILAAFAPAAAASALLSGRRGARRIGDAAGLAAGLTGPPLAAYTAVLLANTAVPLWQQTRVLLPPLFAGSAAASAASLLDMTPLVQRERRVVHGFGMAGKVAELASTIAFERCANRVEQVGRPLREGIGGGLWKAAKALTAGSLALSLLPGDARGRRILSGVLGTAGSVALRFAVSRAGDASSLDPRATFHQQRAGYGAAEVTGRAAVTG